jgi:deoxyribodipyrimidine photo-lyase
MEQPINIFWFRRDMRLNDNAGLYHALKDDHQVLPVFIFDKNILDKLDNKKDSRVKFIRDVLGGIHDQLKKHHSSIEVFYDHPEKVFRSLIKKYRIEKVYTNHDYEPYATERDEAIRKILNDNKISLHTYKDQVIFEKNEIVKDDGSPYVVFTPYSKKWLAKLNAFYLRSYSCEKYFSNFLRHDPARVPSLGSMGFENGMEAFPSAKPDREIIRKYAMQRDFPGISGTSRMGLHLRFGTISIRKLASIAKKESDVYLKELIWRDFYMMILWHFPKVGRGTAFKKEYEHIQWRNNEKEFGLWCEGKTGYPIVDAGMRQLNTTGFMHNRVRMVVASFLAKHLLIDWRWGEAYFAEKLLDYDLAANNGGWQWAAGSGCDAAPYFRVFNPSLQTKKFDPQLEYIRKWVPEFEDFNYPSPVVDHEFARKRCLEVYGKALKRE